MTTKSFLLLSIFVIFLITPVLVRAFEHQDKWCMLDGIDDERGLGSVFDSEDEFSKNSDSAYTIFNIVEVIAPEPLHFSVVPDSVYLDLISPPPKNN
ncbi:hypothetical protein [Leeuwenhoekiella sp. H156]|uniref:hypothetical protein n=1 Tax=Leeuwenhoekiella sp. H156 TaxID=3450128 RepID=UPI003FA47B3F